MRALICESWRPFDDLELTTVPVPTLNEPGDVRIRVRYAGVRHEGGSRSAGPGAWPAPALVCRWRETITNTGGEGAR